jgi:hypothetical protein
VSTKMMRAQGSASVSLHTYQSRLGVVGELRASWNHGCWSEVWFTTSSVITRMPRACAASRNAPEVVHRAVARVDAAVVGDVVAVVAERRGVHRQQPQAVDAEPWR